MLMASAPHPSADAAPLSRWARVEILWGRVFSARMNPCPFAKSAAFVFKIRFRLSDGNSRWSCYLEVACFFP